jgi:hypothetical protein
MPCACWITLASTGPTFSATVWAQSPGYIFSWTSRSRPDVTLLAGAHHVDNYRSEAYVERKRELDAIIRGEKLKSRWASRPASVLEARRRVAQRADVHDFSARDDRSPNADCRRRPGYVLRALGRQGDAWPHPGLQADRFSRRDAPGPGDERQGAGFGDSRPHHAPRWTVTHGDSVLFASLLPEYLGGINPYRTMRRHDGREDNHERERDGYNKQDRCIECSPPVQHRCQRTRRPSAN